MLLIRVKIEATSENKLIRLLLPPGGEMMLQQPDQAAHIQYKCAYHRKIVRSQCPLSYEKQSNISKEEDCFYQKTQDTIVHRLHRTASIV